MTDTPERTDLSAGFSISRLVTGLWQIADMERKDQTVDFPKAVAALNHYVEAGLTTFDMADHYGSAEDIAGLFRKEHGSTVQLFTKWVPKPGPAKREDVRSAIQRSLDRLQSDSIDLLQFHAWNYADPVWLDCLIWLQELKEEGLIRYLGLTNVDTAHLRVIINSGIEIVSNQVCFSLLDQRAAAGMVDLCLKNDIKLLAFGTVAGGFLTDRWLGKPEPKSNQLDTWSQMKYKRFIDISGDWDKFQLLLKTTKQIADKHSVSLSNVAGRIILENPAVGGIIVGARPGQSEHIQDNINLFKFKLDAEDHSRIRGILTTLNPIPGDCGDEYRKPPFLTATGDLSHHLESFPKPYISQTGPDGRIRVTTGTPWEALAGYCRAVRDGERIWVSGTTATHGDRLIGGTDAAAQTHFVIDKIEGALQSLDSSLEDVIRTRVYLNNISDWEAVSRVHGERFRDIQPANTLVKAELVGDEYLVEIEVEAICKENKV